MKLKLYSKELPHWFKIVNSVVLLPIFALPIVAFGSVFILDNPSNLLLAWMLILGLNAYPFYLFVLAELNSRLFIRNGSLGLILPLLSCALMVYGALHMGDSMAQEFEDDREEGLSGIEAGWLGVCDTYRQKEGQIYYHDSLVGGIDSKTVAYIDCHYIKDGNGVYKGKEVIAGADPVTFEILDGVWQKDKAHCYYHGEMMPDIDTKTFTLLQGNYSKDKKSVYYHDVLVKGADASTFKVDVHSHRGKDKYGEYNGAN